jgi:NADPH:quinone reductase-like Zn-dependent oxidoreductase
MLNAGHLYPDVAEVFPFERAAEAHALVEKGAPANVVVAIA